MAAVRQRSQVPEGLWVKCDGCREIIYSKELDKNLMICPKCGYHFRISAPERIGLLIDEVYGQRHFLDSDSKSAQLEEDSPLNSVVSKRHDFGSESWHELDLDRLFTTPEFLNGAAD